MNQEEFDALPVGSIWREYGPPVPGSSLQCGDIVVRSRQWQSSQEDGGAGNRGIVYKLEESNCYVTWKNGNASRYRIREVEKVDRARKIHIGDVVTRAPDWDTSIHGDTDGGAGTKGVVTKFGEDGRYVFVLWPNRHQVNYRWGFAYDIDVVSSIYGLESDSPGGSSRVEEILDIRAFNNNSSSKWCAGDVVVRGPGWRDGDNSDGGEGGNWGNLVEREGTGPSTRIRVTWATNKQTLTYPANALSLLLPGCISAGSVGYKHRMHRFAELPPRTSTSVAFASCRFCSKPVIPINAFAPPFHCIDCNVSLCLACYHQRPPKLGAKVTAGISLPDSRRIFSSNTGERSPGVIDRAIAECGGALDSAVDKFNSERGSRPAESALPNVADPKAPDDPRGMQLTALVIAGDLKNLQRLILQENIGVNTLGLNRSPCVLVAANHGKLEIVEWLLTVPGIELNLADSDGDSALMEAAKHGYAEILALLANGGANVDAQNYKLLSALHMAVAGKGTQEQKLACIDLLLTRGANLELGDEDGDTPLVIACSHSTSVVAGFLLTKGANPNTRSTLGKKNSKRTPLMVAAINGKTEIVALLMKYGACPLEQDSDGDDAVQYAIGGDQEYHEVERLLLESPVANPFMANHNGRTALHRAASKNMVTTMALFLDHPAFAAAPESIDMVDQDGDTALMDAARRGHEAAVCLLVERKANVNLANKKKMTALHLAVAGKQNGTEKVRLVGSLLELGCDIEAPDIDGDTPLSICCSHADGQVAKLLIDRGAKVSVRSGLGQTEHGNRTPLMIAALNGKADIITMLLALGASPLDQDDEGDDAVQYAIGGSDEHHAAIKVLLEAPGASPLTANGQGRTALHRAASKNFITSLRYILDHSSITMAPDGIDVKNKTGDTACHDAARRGFPEVCRMLIERGCDINIRNIVGKRASELSAKPDIKSIFDLAPSIAASAQKDRLARQQMEFARFKYQNSDIITELRREFAQSQLETTLEAEQWLFAMFPSLEQFRRVVGGLPIDIVEKLPTRFVADAKKHGVSFSFLGELAMVRFFQRLLNGPAPAPAPAIDNDEGGNIHNMVDVVNKDFGDSNKYTDVPPTPPPRH